MNFHIQPSKLYKLGFQKDNSVIREKQGLLPQDISSLCYIYANDTKLKQNPYYNNPMFPIRGLFVDYGTPSISADCPCLSNQKNY